MAEFIYVVPIVLLLSLGAIQLGLIFQAKSTLNYAAFTAARAGALNHGAMVSILEGQAVGLTPLFAHGLELGDVKTAQAEASAEVFDVKLNRVEILNPTPTAFEGFAPDGVMPNDNLMYRDSDVLADGMNLQDANLLRVKVTYCYKLIMPILNKLIFNLVVDPPAVLDTALPRTGTEILSSQRSGTITKLCTDLPDNEYRLPIVAESVVRMQSTFQDPVAWVGPSDAVGPSNRHVLPYLSQIVAQLAERGRTEFDAGLEDLQSQGVDYVTTQLTDYISGALDSARSGASGGGASGGGSSGGGASGGGASGGGASGGGASGGGASGGGASSGGASSGGASSGGASSGGAATPAGVTGTPTTAQDTNSPSDSGAGAAGGGAQGTTGRGTGENAPPAGGAENGAGSGTAGQGTDAQAAGGGATAGAAEPSGATTTQEPPPQSGGGASGVSGTPAQSPKPQLQPQGLASDGGAAGGPIAPGVQIQLGGLEGGGGVPQEQRVKPRLPTLNDGAQLESEPDSIGLQIQLTVEPN